MFGFLPGAFGPKRRITNAVHLDDANRVARVIEAGLSGRLYECEYRVVRPKSSAAIMWNLLHNA